MPVSITIILPLLKAQLSQQADVDFAAFPHLNKLLSRSEQTQSPYDDWQALLFSKFGLAIDHQDLPIAAVCRSGEQAKVVEGYWLRVDPVHLQAGLNDSVLYHPCLLDITEAESDALFSDLQKHFDEYVFQKQACNQWYVKWPRGARIKTNSLERVAGGFVSAQLPTGDDSRFWLSFLNEVQMLLFQHPINELRERQGKFAINSVWPYGFGQVPVLTDQCFDMVYSNDSLAAGMAVISNTDFGSLPESLFELLTFCQAHHRADILLLDRSLFDKQLLQDGDSLIERLSEYERNWFAPLFSELKRGDVKKLELDFSTGVRFDLNARKLKQFWRSTQNFDRLL